MATPIPVVLNPAAGSADGALEPIRNALNALGTQFEIHQEGDIEAIVERLAAEADSIIVCGGDGTVTAAVNGIARSGGRPALGIVPLGTANLLAAALGLPTDIEKSVPVAALGGIRKIDIGRCEDRWFVLGLGIGFLERFVTRTPDKEKERIGRLAYAHGLLRELGSPRQVIRIQLDDSAPVSHRAAGVVVANSGQIAEGLEFAPDARIDDGLLDVMVVHSFGLLDGLRLLMGALFGDIRRDRDLSFEQASSVTIESARPLKVQLDGEETGLRLPVTVEVVGAGLRIRVP